MASAQTFRGAIQGTVLDSSGASVPGAQVTVTDTATNLSRQATAGEGGAYLFGELPLGTYKVSAAKAGFRTAVADGITVTTASAQRVDLTLSPGEAKELVEVREQAALVDTVGDTQGGTLDSRQLGDLPTNGRDFDKVILLVPGANADAAGITDSPGSFRHLQHEREPGPVEQLPARRHGHERRLSQRPGHQPGRRVRRRQPRCCRSMRWRRSR